MSDEALLKAAFNLPPEKAVEYFESKGFRITFDWRDMVREAHTKAFTVAGVTKAEVLEDIKKALLEAEKEGLSYGQFKSLIIPTLQKRGWYGRKEVTRPDGSIKKVDLSMPWRLKTIFNTNMRTSMMAGRYKQMMDAVRTRPYWKYLAVEDSRTRESHKVLSGKIFRYDDPIWNTHFPPNGWGCRCRVLSISKDEFEKKGYHLSDGKTARQLAPIPPEWAYNPGKKDWKPDTGKYDKNIQEKLDNELNNIQKADQKSEANEILEIKPGVLNKKELLDSGILRKDWTNEEDIPTVQYLGKIKSPSNIDEAVKALAKYDELIINEPVENGIIITKDGRVFRAKGNDMHVPLESFTDKILKGSFVSHNHLKEKTEYTLSEDDFIVITDLKAKLVRGIDYKYEYWAYKGRSEEDDVLAEKNSRIKTSKLNPENSRFYYMLNYCKQKLISLKRRLRGNGKQEK